MIIRIVSAVVGIAILIGSLLCPYTEVLAVLAAILSAISVWELLRNTGRMRNLVQVIGGMLFSAWSVLLMYYIQKTYTAQLLRFDAEIKQLIALLLAGVLAYGVFTILVYVVSLLVCSIRRKKGIEPNCAVSSNGACYAFLATLYPTAGFGCMMMLREVINTGLWLLISLLMIAWVSDTGAYFVGTFLGKHKMAPKISPKKSWEGFFGGWLISTLCAVGLFYIRIAVENTDGSGLFVSSHIYLVLFTLLAFVLAPLSVVGDLLASMIKRKSGIKDFGNIMPGHGGVMDRFDSVLFIAPLLYLAAMNESVLRNALISVIQLFVG